MKKFYSIIIMLIALLNATALLAQTTYYSKTSGNTNQTATWGTNADGTGTAPSGFTTASDIFILRSASTLGMNGNWTIGAGVTLQVDGLLNVINNNVDIFINGTIIFTSINSTQVSLTGGGTGNSFTLNANATLKTANVNGVRGAGASLPATASGTITLSPSANYHFTGTANQATSGMPATVSSITINNTGASGSNIVTLSQATAVTGTLDLTNGVLNTNTNLLTLNAGSVVAGSSAISFVDGPLKKIGNTAFTFPVGKSGNGIHPISISAPASATDAFTATYFRQPWNVRGTMGTPLTALGNCEHWRLNRDAGSSSVNVTITWNADSPCGNAYVTTLSGLTVGYSSGSGSWGLAAGTGTNISGTTTAGSVERVGVSNFGYFALGSLIAGGSPLPVMYDGVKAYAKNNGAQIEWSNLTERDIKSYRVERSSNGIDYTEIAVYEPKSNRNDKASYTHFDASPLAGANFYRIHAIEIDGKNIFSKILRVEMNGAISLNVYPNPVIGRQMTISLTGMKEGTYNVRIVNASGQDVFKKQLLNKSSSTSEMIELPASAKSGVYTMLISSDNFNTSRMFIIK